MPNDTSRHRGDGEWPTFEEQLAESRVIPRSALERLIRENQDFHMLRPEEAHDRLRKRRWSRLYRCASGGYPMVLRELYE
jgi:hypothetical protein